MKLKVLDIHRSTSAVQDMIRDLQRAALETSGVEVVSMNVTGVPIADVLPKYRMMFKAGLDGVLVRGGDLLKDLPISTRVPTFLDCSTPFEFGPTVPKETRAKLAALRRAVCYSQITDHGLRDAGLGRITMMAGPHLPSVRPDLPDATTVAVIRTSSDAQQVLRELIQYKLLSEKKFEIVSEMTAIGATKATDIFDAVTRATVVLAPVDAGDLGQPHDGAILAAYAGRALITSRTDALTAMGFPTGSFISVVRYSPRSYVTAMDVFALNPEKFLSWPEHMVVDSEALPKLLVSEIMKAAALE